MIKVRGAELQIDVLEELEPYEWYKGRNRGDELTACSPFRKDSSPSFSVSLSSGQWIDFGSSDEYFRKGNLVTLLSFLRQETPEETEQYLLEKYSIDYQELDQLQLNIVLDQEEKKPRIISLDEYKKYAFRSPYLAGRGISEKVQKAFKIGYDKKSNAVAFPWFDVKGNIINVKFRSTKDKRFYYFSDGQPIRNHLYGMHFVFKFGYKKVFLVESEIDALYLWTQGFPAIAIGGSNVNEAQIRLLLRSPIEILVLATDNDAVGKEIRERVKAQIVGYKEIHDLDISEKYKDVNEIPSEELKTIANNTKMTGITLY